MIITETDKIAIHSTNGKVMWREQKEEKIIYRNFPSIAEAIAKMEKLGRNDLVQLLSKGV